MNGEVIHVYDDQASVLILANGRRIPVRSDLYSSPDHALNGITDWAKQTGIIGLNDEIACFS